MKIIKSLCVAVSLFIFNIASAQTPESTTTNWTQVTATRGNFKFSFPNNTYGQFDTLATLYYAKEIDSLLNLQVHYIDNVTTNVSQTDQIWQNALNQNNSDTLRAIGSMMVLLSNGTLEGIQDLPANGNRPRGIEIGIRYISERSDFDLIISRIYYYNSKYLVFTVNSTLTDSVRLGVYKTSFFNSIIFY